VKLVGHVAQVLYCARLLLRPFSMQEISGAYFTPTTTGGGRTAAAVTSLISGTGSVLRRPAAGLRRVGGAHTVEHGLALLIDEAGE
jgi:hypothetical protein